MRDDIEAIRKRLAAAPPGPYSACPMHMYIFGHDGHMVADDGDCEGDECVIRVRGHGAEVSGQRPPGSQAATFEFFAHAHQDITTLLARIAELEAERDQERRKAERWQEVAYEVAADLPRVGKAFRQAQSGILDPEPSDRIRERTADFAPPDERAYTVGDALGLRRTDDPEPER